MARAGRFVAVAVAALGVAWAQDGLPDLSGGWAGTTREKEASLLPGGSGRVLKSAFVAAVLQDGGALGMTIVSEGQGPADLAGAVGNGTFWAVSGDPSAPLLLWGRADRKAKHLSGTLLSGGSDRAAQGKFGAARPRVPPALSVPARSVRTASAAAAADPAPAIDGAWTGTMTGKDWSLETGVKPSRLKASVSLAAAVEGNDASLVLTVHFLDGDQEVVLSGKTGNGAFWAAAGGPSDPVLLAGTVSGKAPRLKMKIRGIRVAPGEVADVSLSLRKSPDAVQGTAAAGAAIAGATVTLKDRNGASASAVTGEGGRFTLDTAGLTPPFLLKVGGYYGFATGSGVANLHPLTDLILRTWYEVKGADVDEAFATLGPATPMPTALEIDLLEALVRRAIGKWLLDRGIDPAAFDLLSTPFAADGTGFDAVLDGTTVAPDGSSLTVTDGTTTQDSSFTLSGTLVTVDTTVTSPAGSSSCQDGTALPGDAGMQEAVAGALAVVESFKARVNARGAALTAADLALFLTADFLEQGEDRALWTAEAATNMRGATIGTVTLRSVGAYDPGNGTVVLDVVMPMSMGDYQEDMKVRMTFRKVGSAWLFHGDRRMVPLQFGVEFRTDYNPWGVDGPRRHLRLDVDPVKGTIQSVSISGGGVFSGTSVPKGPQTRVVTLKPTPATEVDVEFDMFYTGVDVAEFPAPGTEFQLTVTPVSGAPQVITLVSGATTTESVSILQPSGHSLALDAHPGTPFTARWTLPTTFSVERLEFSGTGGSPNFAKDVRPDSPVPRTATQGTVTFPATAGGETVNRADFWLSFEGPNGELIVIVYNFQ